MSDQPTGYLDTSMLGNEKIRNQELAIKRLVVDHKVLRDRLDSYDKNRLNGETELAELQQSVGKLDTKLNDVIMEVAALKMTLLNVVAEIDKLKPSKKSSSKSTKPPESEEALDQTETSEE